MKSQSGNALFLILIAVALFAALSYAVTKSGRGNGNIDKEEAAIIAAKLMNFASSFQTGIQRLQIRGCQPEQMSYANSAYKFHNGTLIWPDGHNAANSPVDGSCELFKATGAGVTPVTMDKNEQIEWPSIVGGNTGYETIGIARRIAIPGIGSALEDVVATYTYIPKAVCDEINVKLGVTTAGAPTPTYGTTSVPYFVNGFFEVGNFTDNSGLLTGKQQFCTQNENLGDHDFAFFQVLIAR